MATQRFRKGRLYRFAGNKWSQFHGRAMPYEIVVVGDVVRCYLDPVQRDRDFKGEFVGDARLYRLDDGHLPDHQPHAVGKELPELMGALKIRFAYPV